MIEKEKERQSSQFLNNVKKAYLVAYNGVQCSGFILIVITLLKCARGGMEGIRTAYDQTATMLMFCQAFTSLEVVNAALGFTKGGIFAPLLRAGRFLIVFVVLQPVEEIHEHLVVFVLFLVWSILEVVRFSYSAVSVLDFEVEKLTWLRYSAWIPLYPVAFTCEGIIEWLAIPHFDESSYRLPYPLNMSIPSTIMRVWLPVIPLVTYIVMKGMAAKRKKELTKLKRA